ncbi:hypothetical protein SEVIR_7G220300v4 [Setaria viridis]|uniref:Uncharacterized protein n=2 Tax=Setaria TaxID=4554 RepID=A0A368RY30_SETIT|nr:hypothetical protein SETIT_7G208500v2 [Setaria italica]TKW06112.1 hypothetical protein SEVIR_7G220300v2 [Setaria viridis]
MNRKLKSGIKSCQPGSIFQPYGRTGDRPRSFCLPGPRPIHQPDCRTSFSIRRAASATPALTTAWLQPLAKKQHYTTLPARLLLRRRPHACGHFLASARAPNFFPQFFYGT